MRDGSGDNETVTIGTQEWTAKNLDVTHYRNGDSIYHAVSDSAWEYAGDNEIGAWCYYDNDPENGAIYGKLYNWYAVNDPRGLAPDGWHVPTDEEWKTLEMALGKSQSVTDDTDEGSKLAGRADLWKDGVLVNNPNFGTSGFLALPGGSRRNTFIHMGTKAYWWSSSEFYLAEMAWGHDLNIDRSKAYGLATNKESGFSVCCVRD